MAVNVIRTSPSLSPHVCYYNYDYYLYLSFCDWLRGVIPSRIFSANVSSSVSYSFTYIGTENDWQRAVGRWAAGGFVERLCLPSGQTFWWSAGLSGFLFSSARIPVWRWWICSGFGVVHCSQLHLSVGPQREYLANYIAFDGRARGRPAGWNETTWTRLEIGASSSLMTPQSPLRPPFSILPRLCAPHTKKRYPSRRRTNDFRFSNITIIARATSTCTKDEQQQQEQQGREWVESGDRGMTGWPIACSE